MKALDLNINKNRIYLIIILILAFIIRLIPNRNLTFAGYDPYLHYDIVMRIVNEGFGVISKDPSSLMGLHNYSYPPLYHILGALLYKLFNTELIFFVIPGIFAVATIYVFYKIAWELFNNEKTAILSTLLFAFVPSFVFRSAIFIPESMGIFLFVCVLYGVIKYIKSIPNYENIDNFAGRGIINLFRGNLIYLLTAILFLCIYLFTHRGWVLLGISLIILLITFIIPTFKKKPVILLGFIIIGVIIAVIVDASNVFVRLQDFPVSLLGFPKWVGVLQLVLGCYGIVVFIKSKNPIYKFLSLWALIFLIIGSYSFRFRDPYSTIPLCLMAGFILTNTIIPKLNELKDASSNLNPTYRKIIPFIIVILILTPIAQGTLSSYVYLDPPEVEELEALNWISNNTPVNATILTWEKDGYLLIGNTHRKDVILYKVIYQGFMGEPPSLTETIQVRTDVNMTLGSSQKYQVYYLLNKYNVSYIFITAKMYRMETTRYGLIEYLPYDTHFKTSYVNGKAAVYSYIQNPTLNPPTNGKINVSNNYSKTVEFIEQFWNGYAYSDIGGNLIEDPALNFEYGGNYNGNYDLNAQIIYLYNYIHEKTADNQLEDRNSYLLQWLKYKQMNDGSFASGTPPAEYTLGTMEVLYPLIKNEYNSSEKNEIITNGISFIDIQTGTGDINISNLKGPIKDAAGRNYITLKTDSQVSGMYPHGKQEIIYNVIGEQKNDGSWKSESYKNIEILKGLCLYYKATNDKKVKESIEKGVKWLKDNQNDNGKFKDDGVDINPYSMKIYADAFYVYYIGDERNYANKTLQYIESNGLDKELYPLTSYLTLLSNLNDIYGMEIALNICNRLLLE